jgi:tagatose-1,6-bisphosphate aldolase non-catalytic subunit AgaZ/GatZ
MISTKALRASLTPMLKVCDRAIDTLTAQRTVIDNQLAAVQLTREALRLGGPRAPKPRRPAQASTRVAKAKGTRPSTQRSAVLAYFDKHGTASVSTAAKALRVDPKLMSARAVRLCDDGKLTKVSRGVYAVKGAR